MKIGYLIIGLFNFSVSGCVVYDAIYNDSSKIEFALMFANIACGVFNLSKALKTKNSYE